MLKTNMAILLICSLSTTAYAGIISYTDRSAFEAQGDILFLNDFESFDTSSTGFAIPDEPYVAEGITYTGSDPLIVGAGSGYTNQSNHFSTNRGSSPVAGSMNGDFNMFAFDVGAHQEYDITLNLTTNVDSYAFNLDAFSPYEEPLSFWGFKLDDGELFSDFSLNKADEGNFIPLMDNVTLGNATIQAAVPEPTSLALLGIGLAGLGLSRRKKNA